MLTVLWVKEAVLVGDWIATVDLKDTCFQIPIWEGPRRFLSFAFWWQNLWILCPPLRHLSGPSHLYQVNGCSLGASVAAGSQGDEILGRIADMCSDRGAVSLSYTDVVGAHPGPGFLTKKCNLQLAKATQFQGMWLDTRSGLVMLDLLDAVFTPLGPHGTESNPPGPYAFSANATGLPCACHLKGRDLHILVWWDAGLGPVTLQLITLTCRLSIVRARKIHQAVFLLFWLKLSGSSHRSGSCIFIWPAVFFIISSLPMLNNTG